MALRTSSGSRRRSSPLSSICLAVDAGARAQPRQRLDDQREAVGQVVAGATLEPHASAVLARDDSEAVVLDFVQPDLLARRLRRFGRKAWRDEAGGGRGIAPPIERGCWARQTMGALHASPHPFRARWAAAAAMSIALVAQSRPSS